MLLVMAAVFVQWIRSDAREAARADRDEDRARGPGSPTRPGGAAPDTELGRYNEYLAALSRRTNRDQDINGEGHNEKRSTRE